MTDETPELKNKAVNVTSDDFNSSDEQPSQRLQERPLENVRQHLQNLIDSMAAESPQQYTSASRTSTECLAGDNDESYYESTSIISSIVQITHVQKQEPMCDTDSSQISALPPDSHRPPGCDVECQYPSNSALPPQENYPNFNYCPRPCQCPNPMYGIVYQPCLPLMPQFGPLQQIHPIQQIQPIQQTPPPPVRVCPPVSQEPEIRRPAMMVNKGTEAESISQYIPEQNIPEPIRSTTCGGQYRLPRDGGSCKWPGVFKCFRRDSGHQDCVNLYVPNAQDHNPPRKLVFDLVTGVPKPVTSNISTNTAKSTKTVAANTAGVGSTKTSIMDTSSILRNYGGIKAERLMKIISTDDMDRRKWKKTEPPLMTDTGRTNRATKMEVYYFDHGNRAYYSTTDCPPLMTVDIWAEKTENFARKFWAESFGTVNVGFAFFTTFILQLIKFILYSIIRPLTVGVIQLACDYFFKPFLAILFNGVVQPILIFIYNIATSLRDLCDPIAEGFGYFLHELAFVCRSIRLCDFKTSRAKKLLKRAGKTPCPCPCPENGNTDCSEKK